MRFLQEANSALVGVVFTIPEELIKVLQDAYDKYKDKTHGKQSAAMEGKKRCETLIKEKQLTYYQIKRMIHDMEHIDKIKNPIAYALNGGEEMYKWATRVLDNARNEVEQRKNSQKRANDIGGLSGIRNNAYLSKHSKDEMSTLNSVLFNKDETNSNSLTPMISEIIRIREIMGLDF